MIFNTSPAVILLKYEKNDGKKIKISHWWYKKNIFLFDLTIRI